jgi:hypothetical protein
VGSRSCVFECEILWISVFLSECEESFKFIGSAWEVRDTLTASHLVRVFVSLSLSLSVCLWYSVIAYVSEHLSVASLSSFFMVFLIFHNPSNTSLPSPSSLISLTHTHDSSPPQKKHTSTHTRTHILTHNKCSIWTVARLSWGFIALTSVMQDWLVTAQKSVQYYSLVLVCPTHDPFNCCYPQQQQSKRKLSPNLQPWIFSTKFFLVIFNHHFEVLFASLTIFYQNFVYFHDSTLDIRILFRGNSSYCLQSAEQ